MLEWNKSDTLHQLMQSSCAEESSVVPKKIRSTVLIREPTVHVDT